MIFFLFRTHRFSYSQKNIVGSCTIKFHAIYFTNEMQTRYTKAAAEKKAAAHTKAAAGKTKAAAAKTKAAAEAAAKAAAEAAEAAAEAATFDDAETGADDDGGSVHPPAGLATSVSAVSAVPGLTVQNVRRAMDGVRTRWKTHLEAAAETPFLFTAPLCDCSGEVLSLQGFCMRFVLGQHAKRHARRERASNA